MLFRSLARMMLSFIVAPGRWDLTDPAQVSELVRTELLAGVLHARLGPDDAAGRDAGTARHH